MENWRNNCKYKFSTYDNVSREEVRYAQKIIYEENLNIGARHAKCHYVLKNIILKQ